MKTYLVVYTENGKFIPVIQAYFWDHKAAVDYSHECARSNDALVIDSHDPNVSWPLMSENYVVTAKEGVVPVLFEDHPLFSGHMTVAIITGDYPKYQATSLGGTEAMAEELVALNFSRNDANGTYDGKAENDLVPWNCKEEVIRDLAVRYGQESYVFADKGQIKFCYALGEHAGTYCPANPGEHRFGTEPFSDGNWTYLPGRGYMRLAFDWDIFLPNPL